MLKTATKLNKGNKILLNIKYNVAHSIVEKKTWLKSIATRKLNAEVNQNEEDTLLPHVLVSRTKILRIFKFPSCVNISKYAKHNNILKIRFSLAHQVT